jgi:hypothetical protein
MIGFSDHALERAQQRFPGIDIMAALSRAVRPDKAICKRLRAHPSPKSYLLFDPKSRAGFVVAASTNAVLTVLQLEPNEFRLPRQKRRKKHHSKFKRVA